MGCWEVWGRPTSQRRACILILLVLGALPWDVPGNTVVEGVVSKRISSCTDPAAVGMLCCVLDFLLHAGGLPEQEQRWARPDLSQLHCLQMVPAGREAQSPGERAGDGIRATLQGEGSRGHGGGV